jgi:hypothetical protein
VIALPVVLMNSRRSIAMVSAFMNEDSDLQGE